MSKPPYTPAHIANFFLWRAEEEDIKIMTMKLIQLVYITYGWYLALKDTRLFAEKIEAWRYGPVIPSLYHEFKRFRSKPIEKYSYSIVFDIENGELEEIPIVTGEDEETVKILYWVWERYKNHQGLYKITQSETSPWHKAYYGQDDKNMTLDDNKMELCAIEIIDSIINFNRKSK